MHIHCCRQPPPHTQRQQSCRGAPTSRHGLLIQMAEPFALTRHRCPGREYEAFTSWLEDHGLLVQGLGPGTAIQLMAMQPLQGSLCRRLGSRALVAETDEELDTLTTSMITSSWRQDGDPDQALHQAIQHWNSRHPGLPVLLGPQLLQSTPPAALLPQGLCLLFGTKRKGCVYHVSSPGWSPAALVRVRSVGKSLACMVVLRLQQQGLLSLDDRASDHLAPWRRPDKAHITLRQLLNHVSGLEPVPDSHPAVSRPDITLAEAAAMLAELPVVAPAGERFVYWGAGYQVVGAVVEQLTGQPFNQVFQELVAVPLGLTGTRFLSPSSTEHSPSPPTNPSIGNACVSTQSDLLQYLAMLVHGGWAAGADELVAPTGASAAAVAGSGGRFLAAESIQLLLCDQAQGADPCGCPMSIRLLRPELGTQPYMQGLLGAGLISRELCGWPSRHKGTAARNFTTLGYFNSALHISGTDSDDPVWFMTLSLGRHTTIWHAYLAALTEALGATS